MDQASTFDCATGLRNRFYPRKPLLSADHAIEQRYGIERRRLISRAVLGWGVVAGYEVTVSDRVLLVKEGLALDRHGREALRLADGAVTGTDLRLLGDDLRQEAERRRNGGDGGGKFRCLLRVHYAERGRDRVRVGDECCDGKPAWNHVCETVVFSLTSYCDTCPPGEPTCPRCTCQGWADEAPSPAATEEEAAHQAEQIAAAPDPAAPADTAPGTSLVPTDTSGKTRPLPGGGDRGPHCCLAEWVESREPAPAPDPLCSHDDLAFDPDDGVPLACLEVEFDKCGCPVFLEDGIDTCTPRRLVKSNDLLFDLIRGCDLTRIEDVSWRDWHLKNTRVGWDAFRAFLGGPPDEGAAERATQFTVKFTGPVRVETLTPFAFAIRCVIGTSESWRTMRRIPITRIDPIRPRDGLTREARLWIGNGWYRQEVDGEATRLSSPFTIEIEVRGDLILDCAGQSVDADPVGLRAGPSGNGTPGGTYFSAFRVAGRPQPPQSPASYE